MGNVSSRADEGASILLRDQNRLTIKSLKITTSNNRVLYTVLPNTFPATRYTVRKETEDDAIVEFVQDPESPPGAAPNFLLRLNSDDDIYFYFTFAIRQTPSSKSQSSGTEAGGGTPATDTNIRGLTFIFAPTLKELDALVTREFNADPNLHKHPNVDLVGDYSTDGTPLEQFEWSWKWRPPKPMEDRGGGWRNSATFVEYDQRAHRLNTLLTFSFWVNGATRRPTSPKSPRLGRTEFLQPPKTRIASQRSVESRWSDSDTEVPQAREPPSPFEVIPEQGAMLEPTQTAEPVKVDINTATLDGDITAADDGPLFRATMKSLESKTGSVRQRMKKVLKKAEAARESNLAANAAVEAFIVALREASTSNANAVQPALEHYFEKIAKEILQYEIKNTDNLQKLIIEPLARIYGNDIKQADAKRKDFEDESREYYSYMSRYLGQRQDSMKEKKRAESDTKYENKRRTFELKRFDYSSFMQDLHGGRKDQEVLSQLTKYADSQTKSYLEGAKKIEALLPQLEALVFEVKEADKQYQLLRTGREEMRRALEKGSKGQSEAEGSSATNAAPSSAAQTPRIVTQMPEVDPFTNSMASSSLSTMDRSISGLSSISDGKAVSGSVSEPGGISGAALSASPAATTGVSPGDKFKGIRDLESRDYSMDQRSTQHTRQGLLWSMSRPGSHADPIGLNKQAWHKFWVVLDQGRLSEYINWKSSPEQHMDPIDLRVASVREARTSERRFCFEVITPNFTRVYQAQGEQDMREWITAINNALQTAFEGRGPPPENSSSGSRAGHIASTLFGKSSSLHGHRTSSGASYQNTKGVSRHSTVSDRPPLTRSRSSEEKPARLLQSIRDADAGNETCADCGSDRRVEWVSLNLGLIVCIECSGIHRSLGTHVSKIRSLTLDTSSFTQDVTELILSIGNRVANMTWEARLDRSQKPAPTCTREERLAFITAKYQQKAYVEPLSASNSHFASPDETLLASIKKNELRNVYYALALSANPNAHDKSRGTHAVFLALVAADPVAPSAIGNASAPMNLDLTLPRKAFPVAELILQNGGELPMTPAPIPLSRSAQLYVEFKKQQKLGRGPGTSNGIANGSSGAATASPVQVKETERREKLVKRNSATQNIAKLTKYSGGAGS